MELLYQTTEYMQGLSRNRGSVSALSEAGEYTTTLYVMVDIVKGDGRAPPPPSPVRANFPIMMECTPESGHCHSMYSVYQTLIEGMYDKTHREKQHLLFGKLFLPRRKHLQEQPACEFLQCQFS